MIPPTSYKICCGPRCYMSNLLRVEGCTVHIEPTVYPPSSSGMLFSHSRTVFPTKQYPTAPSVYDRLFCLTSRTLFRGLFCATSVALSIGPKEKRRGRSPAHCPPPTAQRESLQNPGRPHLPHPCSSGYGTWGQRLLFRPAHGWGETVA